MQKLIYSLLLFTHILFALEIDQKTIYNELLSHTEIYIDKSKQATIDTIKEKSFQINDKEILGFGYAPDFHVWVKFTLTNTSSKRVNTFIEYANPLTSSIKLYDGDTEKLIKKSGLTDASSLRNTINPSFSISVQPNSSKTFYLKAHSETTALIIKLNLWSKDTYYQKEIRYQFILALFFGALGIIIIYHFMIYLSTKEISYLYYVLSFIGIPFQRFEHEVETDDENGQHQQGLMVPAVDDAVVHLKHIAARRKNEDIGNDTEKQHAKNPGAEGKERFSNFRFLFGLNHVENIA